MGSQYPRHQGAARNNEWFMEPHHSLSAGGVSRISLKSDWAAAEMFSEEYDDRKQEERRAGEKEGKLEGASGAASPRALSYRFEETDDCACSYERAQPKLSVRINDPLSAWIFF